MHENEISGIIIDRCFFIHEKLGPGLFESVYEEILAYELEKKGLLVERQKNMSLVWKDLCLDRAFRADLIVEKKVIVEIKSIEAIAPVHSKQIITYLRLSGYKLGLLVNFNVPTIKEGIRRLVNRL